MNDDSNEPSRTSEVRANTVSTIAEGIRVGQAASAQGITQRQIAMIVTLITTIAGAVAGCLIMIYGGQSSALREDHAAIITRTEEVHATATTRMEAVHETSFTRLESMYEGRVNDLKTQNAQLAESLETCLEDHE
jgi:hypothetical protein